MTRGILSLALSTALIAACGGGGGGSVPVVVDPPPVTTPTLSTQAVFTNLSFNQPVSLLQAPGDSSRWFVVEKNGFVRTFANDPNASSASIFLDISAMVNASDEGGLLGLAFHPLFPVVPEVFVSYTRTGAPLESHVSRFLSSDGGLSLDAASEEIILTVDQPNTNHNGGNIAFGPDNFLYIGFGDGGGSGDPGGNGQNTNTLLGAIVRIDVTGGSPYGIPAGNPFESNAVCGGATGLAPCPEIFAWGLRNPWRFNFDSTTSKLWVGDVGQGEWEEIDVIVAGGNYGWNVREGAHCFNPPNGCDNTFIEPISEYDHGLGRSVTGGFVYRGSAIANLLGWYVFGDFITGRLFGIPEDSTSGVVAAVLAESGLQIVSFAEDSSGELYLLHFAGGTIHQLVDAP